ncbi:MerR family transcriptional regulator [Motiliproteus sediminis]|uniref:MerR family transcriptional regulator n=1 Tax=Motiliproteus sediminis TaxID=1468178 RepID=UPI001AEF78FD|nr:MerR family DNA-binding transcriptional regulator [Motiliproteus sediminis]
MSTTFSISQLSKEFGITTRSIRFYEDQGLLEPTRRGQNRIYSRRDRVRLMLILRGKRLGFSLAEIRELFDLYDHNPTNSAAQLRQMLAIISDKKAALEQQMKDIAVVKQELETAEQRCLDALQQQ